MLTVPHADRRLADGRLLRYQGRWQPDPGMRDGAWFLGPHGLKVIASLDATSRWGLKLHVSLSYQHRDPPWADIYQVTRAFFGADTDAIMVLPREADYLHGVAGLWPDSHVFHLWECPEAWRMW
jgi:hypothetical protein